MRSTRPPSGSPVVSPAAADSPQEVWGTVSRNNIVLLFFRCMGNVSEVNDLSCIYKTDCHVNELKTLIFQESLFNSVTTYSCDGDYFDII